MKKIILFILFFCAQFIFSQNFENINKIKFAYSIGGSSWGRNGIYSRSEIFELTKNKKGDFEIHKQIKINEKVIGKVLSKDSIFVKTSKYKIITKIEIEKLLTSLNSNNQNFTDEFLKENLTKPTKKEILEIAKKCDQKDYFKNDYDEKEDIEKKYSQIQELKHFDEYLNIDKPNIEAYMVIMDAWNHLGIITFSKEETKSYDLQFFKNCGQPISIKYLEIDEKEKKVKVIENKGSSIINLNVNLILQKIIPIKTKLWNVLDLKNIRNNYINWYLENKTSEFKY